MPTLDEILNAKTPSDLFPTDLDEKAAQKRFQRFLRVAHPDVNPTRKADAEKAFVNLNSIWKTYTHKTGTAKGGNTNTIKTRRHEFEFQEKRYQVDGTVYYNATYDAGHKDAFIAFAARTDINSLFLEGMRNVIAIRKVANEKVRGFFPEVIDTFAFQNGTSEVSAVALKTEESFKDMFTLRDVKSDYPDGIPARQVAWMYRRMLIALNETHKAGFVHGGAYIDSFMIHPERHGLVLKDWQYSVKINEPARLLNKAATMLYLPEVNDYKGLTPRVDISLAAKAALFLCDEDTPSRFLRALRGTSQFPPADTATAITEFEELIEELWGPKEWQVFKMKRTS
jgi:hypothetical protein